MYCPKCHKEFNEESEYCPFCGYKLSDYKKDILKKFTKENKRNYTITIGISLLIAILSLALMFIFPKYYFIFLIFPCVSFLLDRFLSRQIGLIDLENTPDEVMKYLKKSSLFVGMTNIVNMVTIVYGIVKIVIDLI